jgi:predicted CXXCH cytochrome family protein
MNRGIMKLKVVVFFFLCMVLFFPQGSHAQGGIISTEHNLSVSGPGELKALSETRICIFCHTPHNAAPRTPLWNRSIEPLNYTLYTSPTMELPPSQPNGPSRLCLSCHDGTVALGAVLQPVGGIATTGEITFGRPSYLGTILSDDHPFSISYSAVKNNPYAGLNLSLGPTDLPFYGGAAEIIECATCHDPHEDRYRSPDKTGRLTGKFLVRDNRSSAFCITCHSNIKGWDITNVHRTSMNPVSGVLPVPPKNWPTWQFVSEWGCEGCHTPHTAGVAAGLLYYDDLEKDCIQCHNGRVATKNIENEINKSGHKGAVNVVLHSPTESVLSMPRHVECVDCHNPHSTSNASATAPFVSGMTSNVSGVTADGTELLPVNQQYATKQYEICFRCHADYGPQIPFIPRVIDSTNTRLEFQLINPSYHPVEGIGRNMSVPSLITNTLTVPSLNLTTSSIIYCTDCHDSDDSSALVGNNGPRGPHGSIYAPILRERYETSISMAYSDNFYALCYRCHSSTSIRSDVSFRKNSSGQGGHSGHLDAGAPCSVCHDPHGIVDTPGTGSHTNLINFDTRYVSAVTGNVYPLFSDNGINAGSCTLVCHMSPGDPSKDVVHNNASYQ